MVYKIGTTNDLESLPYIPSDIREVIVNDVTILDKNYGCDRDVDNDDGGYVIYCPPETELEDLKEVFDYTSLTPEFVNLVSYYCHAVYVISNEYAVSVFMAIDDAPKEITDEI